MYEPTPKTIFSRNSGGKTVSSSLATTIMPLRDIFTRTARKLLFDIRIIYLKNFEIILIAKLMVIFNTNYHELPINCCA